MKFIRSSLITKLVILAIIVYAGFTLVSLQKDIDAKQADIDTASRSISQLEEENTRLQSAIDSIGTEEGIRSIARDKLGLVAPGEIVFYDAGNG